jgi:hypothetical protein
MRRRPFADQGNEYATMHVHRTSQVSGGAVEYLYHEWKYLLYIIKIWPADSNQTANVETLEFSGMIHDAHASPQAFNTEKTESHEAPRSRMEFCLVRRRMYRSLRRAGTAPRAAGALSGHPLVALVGGG